MLTMLTSLFYGEVSEPHVKKPRRDRRARGKQEENNKSETEVTV